MKMYELTILPDAEQYQAIWDNGVHVGNIEQDGLICSLYAINDFFAEVRYNKETNKIVDKKVFRTGDYLDNYLDKLPEF
jgi:hypothetical protein